MTATIRRGTIVSFQSSDWTAVVMLDGALSDTVMPVGEWIPSGMLDADDEVAILLFEATNPDDGLVLGPYGAVSTYNYPELTGLATGAVLRATSATAAAFGAVDLADADAVTGILPVANGGSGLASSPIGARIYYDTNLPIPNNLNAACLFNQERWDTDTCHDTTTPNLTGTVAKTNGSATLTGTSTLFTPELKVGQYLRVPGGATEDRWISAITNDLSLTVSSNYANTSSGQTAQRINSTRLTCKTAGKYLIVAHAQFAANATGYRGLYPRLNGATYLDGHDALSLGAGTGLMLNTSTLYDLAVNDYIEIMCYQNSGGVLNVNSSGNYSPEAMFIRIP